VFGGFLPAPQKEEEEEEEGGGPRSLYGQVVALDREVFIKYI
jgi:hypothetical protein